MSRERARRITCLHLCLHSAALAPCRTSLPSSNVPTFWWARARRVILTSRATARDTMLDLRSLSDIDKPLIKLYACGEDSLGLIILRASGVVYTNQTGGHYCSHPSAEGVFMPIGNGQQQRAISDVFGGGASSSINEREADAIDEVLSQNPDTRILTVDRARLSDSHESWVFLRVASHPGHFPALPLVGDAETYADPNSPINQSFSPIFGFGPSVGILTWPNSD